MPPTASEESRQQNFHIYMILALIVAVGLAFRILGVLVRPGLDHDEALVFVLATCNQRPWEQIRAEYQASGLKITDAAYWQEFIHLRRPFCLDTIASDLRRMELHPPMFHWLVNIWMSLLGDSLIAVRLLNVTLDVGSILVLFCAAKALFGHKYALLAAALYALTPAFLKISSQVRSYALLGLCNLIALWAVCQILRKPAAWGWWIVWATAVSFGLATEYLFSVVLAPMAFYLFWFFLKRKYLIWRQFATSAFIVTVFGVGTAWFYWQQKNYAAHFGWKAGAEGGRLPVSALFTLLADVWHISYNFLDTLPLIVLLVMSTMAIGLSFYGLWATKEHDTRWLLLLLFSTTVFGPIAFYTLGLTPEWAYGAKYQSTAVPYILLSATCIIRKVNHQRLRTLATLALVTLVALSSIKLIRFGALNKMGTLMSDYVVQQLPQSDLVILDTMRTGMLFPAVSSWPSTQQILIGKQQQMLNGTELQDAICDKKSVIYVSALQYGNPESHRRILTLLQSEFGSPELPPQPLTSLGCWTCGRGYQVYFFNRQENG